MTINMSNMALATMAQDLIEANGRPCTFSRKGQVSADLHKTVAQSYDDARRWWPCLLLRM